MNEPGLLIFDMDGVLVEVGESYRESVRRTVAHFTGETVSNDLIQQYKNAGGWNDDWALTARLIQDLGVHPPFDSVVEQFQKIFRGDNGTEGLIFRERWNAREGLFTRLARSWRLAIFTGRLHEEAHATLQRFAPQVFDPIVGADDVRALKPNPEGLKQILAKIPSGKVFYFGDSVDDARSAEAAAVPFIGVVGPESPRRDETASILRDHGALAVLASVNDIEREIADL